MKVKSIKENINIRRAALRTPIKFGLQEGYKKQEAEFALIDNREKELRSPIIITRKQLKEVISTTPQEVFEELQEEGVIKIVKGKFSIKSTELVNKEKLIKLGLNEDKVKTMSDPIVIRNIREIRSGSLFIVDGELISKANKALAEREGIVKAAVAAGVTDPKTLALPNEQLIAKTEEATVNNKKDAEELEVTLSKLKLLLDEAKFNEIKDAKIDVLKVVFTKAEKHYDTQFSEFKEVIKGFVDEQNLLNFVGLDKDITKLETAKNDYSDAKDKIEKEATEAEAKKAKEEAEAEANAKKLEAKKAADKAKEEAKKAKEEAKKAEKLEAKAKADAEELKVKEAEELKVKEAPGPVVLQRPKEDNK